MSKIGYGGSGPVFEKLCFSTFFEKVIWYSTVFELRAVACTMGVKRPEASLWFVAFPPYCSPRQVGRPSRQDHDVAACDCSAHIIPCRDIVS